MPWVGKPGWPPTQSISIWWPRNETQQSSYILHFICLGPLIQSLRLHVQLQFLLHMLLTLSGGKSLVRVIVFSLNAWNKVCGYHKLKIFTRFVLLFQCAAHWSIIDWKQCLLLGTHCISHVKRFPWNHFEKHILRNTVWIESSILAAWNHPWSLFWDPPVLQMVPSDYDLYTHTMCFLLIEAEIHSTFL